MNTIKLDEWDFKFIQYFKRSTPHKLTDLLLLWGERCGISPDYPGMVGAMVEHFLPIIAGLELEKFSEMVIMSNPAKRWRYSINDSYPLVGATDEEKYWIDWLATIGTVFMLAYAKDLPGYIEWLDKEKLDKTKDI